ncbi:MAG: hypothetical protein LBD43_00055, partial [Holosporales bacterium]|nr:hypothetical protein [Holosporales bacterium]
MKSNRRIVTAALLALIYTTTAGQAMAARKVARTLRKPPATSSATILVGKGGPTTPPTAQPGDGAGGTGTLPTGLESSEADTTKPETGTEDTPAKGHEEITLKECGRIAAGICAGDREVTLPEGRNKAIREIISLVCTQIGEQCQAERASIWKYTYNEKRVAEIINVAEERAAATTLAQWMRNLNNGELRRQQVAALIQLVNEEKDERASLRHEARIAVLAIVLGAGEESEREVITTIRDAYRDTNTRPIIIQATALRRQRREQSGADRMMTALAIEALNEMTSDGLANWAENGKRIIEVEMLAGPQQLQETAKLTDGIRILSEPKTMEIAKEAEASGHLIRWATERMRVMNGGYVDYGSTAKLAIWIANNLTAPIVGVKNGLIWNIPEDAAEAAIAYIIAVAKKTQIPEWTRPTDRTRRPEDARPTVDEIHWANHRRRQEVAKYAFSTPAMYIAPERQLADVAYQYGARILCLAEKTSVFEREGVEEDKEDIMFAMCQKEDLEAIWEAEREVERRVRKRRGTTNDAECKFMDELHQLITNPQKAAEQARKASNPAQVIAILARAPSADNLLLLRATADMMTQPQKTGIP